MSRLYGNQAGPTKGDAASTDPRSRMIMLGIFHMNATTRAGSPSGFLHFKFNNLFNNKINNEKIN
jgi:hypothetical protein